MGAGCKIDPDQVLEAAKGKLSEVVVIGFEKDRDGILYMASSEGPGDTLWLVEVGKRDLLTGFQEP